MLVVISVILEAGNAYNYEIVLNFEVMETDADWNAVVRMKVRFDDTQALEVMDFIIEVVDSSCCRRVNGARVLASFVSIEALTIGVLIVEANMTWLNSSACVTESTITRAS